MEVQVSTLESWKLRARRLKVEVYALYLAYRDPRVPWYARLFAAAVVGYAFSPIDLIPDIIPVLGYLDDLVLVPLGIVLALKMIPADVMVECRERAKEALREGRPTNWVVAGVIFGIWLLLAVLALALVLRLVNR
ncbi:MAG: YkvA family protein [Nitrososphaerota archaeon]